MGSQWLDVLNMLQQGGGMTSIAPQTIAQALMGSADPSTNPFLSAPIDQQRQMLPNLDFGPSYRNLSPLAQAQVQNALLYQYGNYPSNTGTSGLFSQNPNLTGSPPPATTGDGTLGGGRYNVLGSGVVDLPDLGTGGATGGAGDESDDDPDDGWGDGSGGGTGEPTGSTQPPSFEELIRGLVPDWDQKTPQERQQWLDQHPQEVSNWILNQGYNPNDYESDFSNMPTPDAATGGYGGTGPTGLSPNLMTMLRSGGFIPEDVVSQLGAMAGAMPPQPTNQLLNALEQSGVNPQRFLNQSPMERASTILANRTELEAAGINPGVLDRYNTPLGNQINQQISNAAIDPFSANTGTGLAFQNALSAASNAGVPAAQQLANLSTQLANYGHNIPQVQTGGAFNEFLRGALNVRNSPFSAGRAATAPLGGGMQRLSRFGEGVNVPGVNAQTQNLEGLAGQILGGIPPELSQAGFFQQLVDRAFGAGQGIQAPTVQGRTAQTPGAFAQLQQFGDFNAPQRQAATTQAAQLGQAPQVNAPGVTNTLQQAGQNLLPQGVPEAQAATFQGPQNVGAPQIQGQVENTLSEQMRSGGLTNDFIGAMQRQVYEPMQEQLLGDLNRMGGGYGDLSSGLNAELQRRANRDFQDSLIRTGFGGLQNAVAQGQSLGGQQFGQGLQNQQLQQQARQQQAGFQQQAELANQQAGLQGAGLGFDALSQAGQFQLQPELANQQLGGQFGLQQGQFQQQANLANQQAQNQASSQNLDAALRGAGLGLQATGQLAGLQNQLGQFNAGQLQQGDLANQQAQLQAQNLATTAGLQGLGMLPGLADLELQRQVQQGNLGGQRFQTAADLLGQAAGLNLQGQQANQQGQLGAQGLQADIFGQYANLGQNRALQNAQMANQMAQFNAGQGLQSAVQGTGLLGDAANLGINTALQNAALQLQGQGQRAQNIMGASDILGSAAGIGQNRANLLQSLALGARQGDIAALSPALQQQQQLLDFTNQRIGAGMQMEQFLRQAQEAAAQRQFGAEQAALDRALQRYAIQNNQPGFGSTVAGGILSGLPGIIGGLASLSSEKYKENIEVLDPTEAKRRLMSSPVRKWSYKGSEIRHTGPVLEESDPSYAVGDKLSLLDAVGTNMAVLQSHERELHMIRETLNEIKELLSDA